MFFLLRAGQLLDAVAMHDTLSVVHTVVERYTGKALRLTAARAGDKMSRSVTFDS